MTGFSWGGSNGATWGDSNGSTWGIGPPAAPEELQATAASDSEIALSWTIVGVVESINIYRARSESSDLGDYEHIATVDAPSESYVDDARVNGRAYHYRVTGVNAVGESDPSNDADATTDLPDPTLEFDTDAEREIGISVTLEDDNDEGDVTLYRDGGEITTLEDLSNLEYTDENRLDGERYSYHTVRDTGDTSTETVAEDVVAYLPDAEGLLMDASVQSQLTATWDAVLNNGQYRLEFRDDDPDSDHPPYEPVTTVNYDGTLEEVITGLVDGEQYSVRLRTETDHATGEWLIASPITKLVPPSAVTIVETTEFGATISWTDESDFRGSNQVYRRRIDYDYAGPGRLVGTVAEDATEFVDESAAPDREYEYHVRAMTQWAIADSDPTDPATTNGVGLSQRTVPSQGWYCEIDRLNGQTRTPDIIGDAVQHPEVNDQPRVELPAPRDESWHDDSYDDVPMRVFNSGILEPIELLEHRRVTDEQTILEGRGGIDLDTRVIEDVSIEPVHEFAEGLISEYTDYIPNVDAPLTETEGRTLESADSTFELAQATVEIPEDKPITIEDDAIEPLQTCWLFDAAEYYGGQSGIAQGEDYTNGEAAYIGDRSDGIVDMYFTTEYRIEEPEIILRGEYIDFVEMEIQLDDTRVLHDQNASLGWNVHEIDGPIEPGQHHIDYNCIDTDRSGHREIDIIGIRDGRYSYTDDGTVHEPGGHLNGPEPYPDEALFETIVYSTPLAMTEASLTVQTNDSDGAVSLALRDNGDGNYDTALDTSSHTVSYSELAAEAQGRVGVGRRTDLPPQSETPRYGYEPQQIDTLELSAMLDDTPVITNRSFDDRLINVLQELADIGNFVFEVGIKNGDTTVEWSKIDQRTPDVDPNIVDYEVDRQTVDKVERAIIYGGSQRLTRQTVDVSVGSWVDLPFTDSRLVEGQETIYDGDTEFSRGTDYEIQYTTEDGIPKLRALLNGELTSGQTVSVDAAVKPRGEYTESGIDPDEAKTIIEEIPGLASKQMCDQTALYLVEQTGDAIFEVDITVPNDGVGWSVIDAIDPEKLPGEGPYQTREIESTPEQTIIRAASRERLRGMIQTIQQNTQRNSKRV